VSLAIPKSRSFNCQSRLGHIEEVKRRLGFVGSPRVFHRSPAEESAYATAYNSARARHPDRAWPDPRLSTSGSS
jgi:hypothetical protein